MAKSEILRERLEVFISKYYKNQLIKGGIYSVSLGAMYFFLVALAEYIGRFGGGVRLGLFIGLVLGLLIILGYYILYPLSKLLKVGKRISYERAASIIGKHFPEVDDKLLNTIQLDSLSGEQNELIQASIDQKIRSLSPVPFTKAIDFGENRKYWPILVIPVLVFAIVLISGQWEGFRESSRRIAEYNVEFVAKAPFEFRLLNEDLSVEQGESVRLILQLDGNKVPGEASAVLGDEEIRMKRDEDGVFSLLIPDVESGFEVKFRASGYDSKTYEFDVLPVPQLEDVRIRIIPPSYTGLAPSQEELRMVHDVPEGSKVSWYVGSTKADKAWFVMDTVAQAFEAMSSDEFRYEMVSKNDIRYGIDVENEKLRKKGVSGNRIHVLRDEYPSIEVRFVQDSSQANVLYYTSIISDDYGFSAYKLVIEHGGKILTRKIDLQTGLNQRVSNALELDSLADTESQNVKVYLKVYDNDRVNGAKSTSSQGYVLKLIGKQERREELEKGYKQYFQAGEQKQQDREEIKKALDELRRSLLEKKSLSFKEKAKLKEVLKKQEMLLQQQRENEDRLEKLKNEEEKVESKKEELKEDEEKVDELSEKDKEIEDLIKEIQELMEKLDTSKLKEKLEDLQKANKKNQRTQDRKDDLLKDLKLKKDILENADRLKNLSEQMEKLAEKSGDEQKEAEEQDQIEKEFEDVSKKLDEMRSEDESFKKESEREGLNKSEEDAKQEMEKASEKLGKKDSQGANKNQKSAGEKMKEMSEGLTSTMMGMQAKSNQENIETLRQILENLETVSFGVESLSGLSRSIDKDDPGIKDLLTEQKRLMDGAVLIEDSLVALASRAPQIQQMVFEELDAMKENMEAGIVSLQEVETQKAAVHQQYVMTAANNLALMLELSLQNMMQMQAQMMPGQQQCQKPGDKPNGQTLKEMQSQMGKMMDKLKEGQQKGEQGKMSKEIVETISKQEQLRQALEEMQRKQEGDGGNGDRQKAIEELKKLQEDLMDGKIADNYRERLKEIETRLLESEKAERKQKQDEKREAKTADDLRQLYSQELEKYLKEKESEEETLERVPVNFKAYYKSQTGQYLNQP